MNASKFLVSTASALMVVGGIGLAYAQTTTEPSTTPTPMQAPNEQAPMNQPADTMTPSTSDATSPQSGDLNTTQDELAPQADRN